MKWIIKILLILLPLVSEAQFTFTSTENYWRIDYDNNSNVYVLYSGPLFKVDKYTSSGTLLWTWTFPTLYGANLADIAVNRSTEEVYVLDASNSAIYWLNSSGVKKKYFYMGTNTNLEVWKIVYNSCTNQLILGQGQDTHTSSFLIVDPNLTWYTAYTIPNVTQENDFTYLELGDYNDVYLLCAEQSIIKYPGSNDLVKISYNSPASVIWQTNNGSTFKEISSVTYTGMPTNQFNGIVVDNTDNYVYTYDGRWVRQYYKNIGTLVKKIASGGQFFTSAGIAVDNSGYVYIGLSYGVIRYNKTGVTYSGVHAQAPSSINTVYDVRVGNGMVYFCGKNFISVVPAYGTVTCSETLPIELIEFKGVQKGDKIELSWRTGSEFNNQKFIISRSAFLSHFQPITEVLGAFSTSSTRGYRSIDIEPLIGWNYYKLESKDINGDIHYQGITPVFFNPETEKIKYNILGQEIR